MIAVNWKQRDVCVCLEHICNEFLCHIQQTQAHPQRCVLVGSCIKQSSACSQSAASLILPASKPFELCRWSAGDLVWSQLWKQLRGSPVTERWARVRALTMISSQVLQRDFSFQVHEAGNRAAKRTDVSLLDHFCRLWIVQNAAVIVFVWDLYSLWSFKTSWCVSDLLCSGVTWRTSLKDVSQFVLLIPAFLLISEISVS